MDPEQAYRFDLDGYIVLRRALTPGSIADLLAIHRRQPWTPTLSNWFNNAANRTRKPSDFVIRESGDRVNPDGVSAAELAELTAARRAGDRSLCPLHWGEPVRELIAHPLVWPILEQLCGENFRLDHVNVRPRACSPRLPPPPHPVHPAHPSGRSGA